MPVPRGGFYTPFTFHAAVCVCIQLLACTSEGPRPACRQLSCPEPGAGSAPARSVLGMGGKSEQEGPAYPGTPLHAGPLGKQSWFWVVPTCHQLAGCHGHLHSCARGQGASPGARTARGSSSKTPTAQEPAWARGFPSDRRTAASNSPFSWEMLVSVALCYP